MRLSGRAVSLERMGNFVNWLSVPAFIVWLWYAFA